MAKAFNLMDWRSAAEKREDKKRLSTASGETPMDGKNNIDEVTETVPAVLQDGTRLHIEVRTLGGGREEVGVVDTAFSDLSNSIEAIAVALGESLNRIKPKKAAVEFGIEVALESGKLTALICKGTGKANLKITLEFIS